MLRSSRLFFRRFSSSACSSFYLLSCGPVSVGSSLLFLASFPLRALPAVFAVVFPSLSGTVDIRGRLSSCVVSVPGRGLMLPPVVLFLCTVRALPLFLLVWLFFRVVFVLFSFLLVLLLVLFLLLPLFIRSGFLCTFFFFFFVGFFFFSNLLFLFFFSSFLFFRPRSSVRVSGFCGVASSWAFPVALLCLLFWRPLSGLPPLSCLFSVCSLFPSFLLASFYLGSFAGCS